MSTHLLNHPDTTVKFEKEVQRSIRSHSTTSAKRQKKSGLSSVGEFLHLVTLINAYILTLGEVLRLKRRLLYEKEGWGRKEKLSVNYF